MMSSQDNKLGLKGYKGRLNISQKVKLRTIQKSRASQQVQKDQKQSIHINNSLKQSSEKKLTLPETSHNHNYLSNANIRVQSRFKTLSYQNQGEMSLKCQSQNIWRKLGELDAKAEKLIQKKIGRIAKKEHNISLRGKGADELSEELEQIIREIKNLKIDDLKSSDIDHKELDRLMNYKIEILEKLMAEKTIESEVLKKYFFAISASNQKKKFGAKKQRYKTEVNSRLDTFCNSNKNLLCDSSSTRVSYQAPKPHQYETYRHKNKEFSANLQPLPRSVYKSEFLTYSPPKKEGLLRNLDSPTFFKNRRNPTTSEYNYQFNERKADRVNYKELDSYRDKFKDLQVSYSFNKNELSPEELDRNKKYVRQVLKQSLKVKSPQVRLEMVRVPEALACTQSQTKYIGQLGNRSQVKHKRLSTLQYEYRGLMNC